MNSAALEQAENSFFTVFFCSAQTSTLPPTFSAVPTLVALSLASAAV